MPLFNWDGGELPVISRGFKYYWVIAIPLTILVLLIWIFVTLVPWASWIQRSKGKMEKKGDVEAMGGERFKDE